MVNNHEWWKGKMTALHWKHLTLLFHLKLNSSSKWTLCNRNMYHPKVIAYFCPWFKVPLGQKKTLSFWLVFDIIQYFGLQNKHTCQNKATEILLATQWAWALSFLGLMCTEIPPSRRRVLLHPWGHTSGLAFSLGIQTNNNKLQV